jgi:queuosine precursor transporter
MVMTARSVAGFDCAVIASSELGHTGMNMQNEKSMAHAHILDVKASRLFLVFATFLAANALIAEFVGVKIFALEPTLGMTTLNWNLFGQQGSLQFTSGVLLWPLVFLLTDIINEYYGTRGVRFISWLTVALIGYGFLAAYLAIALVPADFWVTVNRERGVDDMQAAFANIFGQGMWTIAGSITAFLVGQLIDVSVFHRIRRLTGERWIWLRATGSTAISQFVDSFVVLYIAFVLGPQQWPTSLFLAVGTVNYGYKMAMAILLIPAIYLTRAGIRAYLGADQAEALRLSAQC